MRQILQNQPEIRRQRIQRKNVTSDVGTTKITKTKPDGKVPEPTNHVRNFLIFISISLVACCGGSFFMYKRYLKQQENDYEGGVKKQRNV